MNFGARLKVMLSCMEYGVMLYEGSDYVLPLKKKELSKL